MYLINKNHLYDNNNFNLALNSLKAFPLPRSSRETEGERKCSEVQSN